MRQYCVGKTQVTFRVFIVAEPDLGATAVIVLMMVGVFFLAGAPATQFLIMLGAILAGITALILFEPFRFQRLISFTNPWADPLGVGYQLSNALMAFGRGEWFGTGLGIVSRNFPIFLKHIQTLC